MAIRIVIVVSVLIVLVRGSHISPVEPQLSVEIRSAGDVTSGAAITFPETRPSPGSQSQSSSSRSNAPRSGGASRSVGGSRPAASRLVAAGASRRQGGSRPSVVISGGRPIGGGSGRNRIQKPF
ncbi:uncharacterized protein LOC108111579 [Drosophila eugracilis]|uniref:uncharacterized protein LOC108111579 n=1 Tax=Drosophila eugracilis TaxID=29029 RepID=UPI0007E7C6A2|nr:uncharacterized protein LOC108111579 [Drosophila eugracilis]